MIIITDKETIETIGSAFFKTVHSKILRYSVAIGIILPMLGFLLEKDIFFYLDLAFIISYVFYFILCFNFDSKDLKPTSLIANIKHKFQGNKKNKK
jgi:hypothetical protein